MALTVPFWIRNWSGTRFSCCCWGDLFKKVYDSVVSNWIGMEFGRIVLQVNTHRLTEWGFSIWHWPSRWRRWRHFTQKVLPSGECTCSICPEHYAAASARSWSIIHSYLLVKFGLNSPEMSSDDEQSCWLPIPFCASTESIKAVKCVFNI